MKDCLLLSIARLNRSTLLGPQWGPLRLGEEGFGLVLGSGRLVGSEPRAVPDRGAKR